MIELRWVEKPKVPPIYDIGENVRVLQYRKTIMVVRWDSAYPCEEWSDWQDVPVVTEK